MDPPIPATVLSILDAAEGDLRLLTFKYAALAAAIAQRPRATAPAETGEDDGGVASSAGAADGGGEVEGDFSEDDLLGLLEQHVSFRNVFVGIETLQIH